jgi:hypothetical protein
MEKGKKILLTVGFAVILFLGLYAITGAISMFTGYFISGNDKDDVAVCLGEKNIKLYVNTNDLASTLKKMDSRDYLGYAKIVNCMRNNQECINNNINTFPTWVIFQQRFERDISLDELKTTTGCKPLSKE